MKPILFNTKMVRAILEGRKTVTRRVVKLHNNCCEFCAMKHLDVLYAVFSKGKSSGYEFVRAPYRNGDILYVRETWAAWSRTTGTQPALYYKADGNAPDGIKWCPSIHMPREAARIFLRVKDVRVERLQEITEEQAQAEGTEPFMMTADVDKPDDEKRWQEMLPALSMFPALWDSTIKKADRAIYGWEANPFVWVIEFGRCEREVKRDES